MVLLSHVPMTLRITCRGFLFCLRHCPLHLFSVFAFPHKRSSHQESLYTLLLERQATSRSASHLIHCSRTTVDLALSHLGPALLPRIRHSPRWLSDIIDESKISPSCLPFFFLRLPLNIWTPAFLNSNFLKYFCFGGY